MTECIQSDLKSAASDAWNRFLAIVDPLRPALFRYCRRLTGNLWDAEDLIQDTLEQAFARLATVSGQDVTNPRAYVLRIASNLWISRLRRDVRHDRAMAELGPSQPGTGQADGAGAPAETELQVRDAADRLMSRLSPQEQASVVLKEVFELSLEETADVLGTTVGAVKTALHRGRARLQATTAPGAVRHDVSRPVLEQFVDRFNARDRAGLLALMLDSAAIRMPGVDYEIGRDAFTREPGWMYYNLSNPASHWEVAEFEGEPVVLVLSKDGGDVGSVMRISTVADRVAEIRVYAFCPDAVREVAAAMSRAAEPMGLYRFDPVILQHAER